MTMTDLLALSAETRRLADEVKRQVKEMRADVDAAKRRELDFIAKQNERKESEKPCNTK